MGLKNGSVVAWGNKYLGGKIPEAIQTQLQNVNTIFSTDYSFAALLHDDSVFSWGIQDERIPDDIQTQLHKNVNMIFSNSGAFLALLKDGRFVSWGNERYGGKITDEIQTQVKNVKVIFSSSRAFAALLDNGSVFTWGHQDDGGKIPNHLQFKLR